MALGNVHSLSAHEESNRQYCTPPLPMFRCVHKMRHKNEQRTSEGKIK